jgi:hypothetical protein
MFSVAAIMAPQPEKQGPKVLYQLESLPVSLLTLRDLRNPMLLETMKSYVFDDPQKAIQFAGNSQAIIKKIQANFKPQRNEIVGNIGQAIMDSQYKFLGKFTAEQLKEEIAIQVRSQAKYADDGLPGIEMVSLGK